MGKQLLDFPTKMKHLMKYFNGYMVRAILAPLFKMLEAILELFVPLVVAKIIDTGIESGDKTYIIKMCALLVLLGAVGLAFSLTAQFFAAKASAFFRSRLYQSCLGIISAIPALTTLENKTL